MLASYPRDRNPLESGYLLHPERIQGKAAVDQFERDRIQEVQDTAAGLDDAGRRKASEMVRAMRRAAAELRTKEIESNVDADGLAERYGIVP